MRSACGVLVRKPVRRGRHGYMLLRRSKVRCDCSDFLIFPIRSNLETSEGGSSPSIDNVFSSICAFGSLFPLIIPLSKLFATFQKTPATMALLPSIAGFMLHSIHLQWCFPFHCAFRQCNPSQWQWDFHSWGDALPVCPVGCAEVVLCSAELVFQLSLVGAGAVLW